MSEFVAVAKVGSIPEGEGATFPLADRLVAVFNHGGEYYAIDDLCPHMGASLGAGQLDQEGKVMCPWHAWRFDVCDGTWCDNPRLKIDAFEVRIEGDEIQVAVSKPQSTDSDGPTNDAKPGNTAEDSAAGEEESAADTEGNEA